MKKRILVVDDDNMNLARTRIILGKNSQSFPQENQPQRIRATVAEDGAARLGLQNLAEAVTALGANLLKLHPCVEVIGGKMSVTKKYRGNIAKVVADYDLRNLLRRQLGVLVAAGKAAADVEVDDGVIFFHQRPAGVLMYRDKITKLRRMRGRVFAAGSGGPAWRPGGG